MAHLAGQGIAHACGEEPDCNVSLLRALLPWGDSHPTAVNTHALLSCCSCDSPACLTGSLVVLQATIQIPQASVPIKPLQATCLASLFPELTFFSLLFFLSMLAALAPCCSSSLALTSDLYLVARLPRKKKVRRETANTDVRHRTSVVRAKTKARHAPEPFKEPLR